MGAPRENGTPEGGSTLKMTILAMGVLGSFTAFGYAQEAVTRTPFGEAKEFFAYSTFLVLVQSVGNAVVAGIILVCRDGGKTKFSADVKLSDWIVVGLGYFGAHKLGLAALGFITFPMQVVCKSCKAIPVMLGERLFAGKRHSAAKMCGVLCMSAGVVLFALAGPQKKKGNDAALDRKMVIGLALVFGALLCDGVYGPYQNKIVKSYTPAPTAYHLMFNMNLTQFFIALALCLVDVDVANKGSAPGVCLSLGGGELIDAFQFTKRHPDVLRYLGLFAAAMALGNIFIYKLQAEFGALTVTTVTTLRKLISVVFSVFIFGHALSNTQWLAVLVVVFHKYIGNIIAIPFQQQKTKAS